MSQLLLKNKNVFIEFIEIESDCVNYLYHPVENGQVVGIVTKNIHLPQEVVVNEILIVRVGVAVAKLSLVQWRVLDEHAHGQVGPRHAPMRKRAVDSTEKLQSGFCF